MEPENVLLDQGGHIRLTDFDQAQKIENIENQKLLNLKDNLPSLVINKVPTEVMSDYWKLVKLLFISNGLNSKKGYFIYELLTGIKPYKYGGKSLEEIEKQISSVTFIVFILLKENRRVYHGPSLFQNRQEI